MPYLSTTPNSTPSTRAAALLVLTLPLPLRAQALHDTSPLVDQNVATLEVGQRVRVRGLTKHIQLNSKYGVIATAPKKDGGRYGVLVEFITDAPDLGPGGKSLVVTQDPLAIKRENLEIAPPRLPHSVLCASTYGRLDEVTAYLDAGGDIEVLRCSNPN